MMMLFVCHVQTSLKQTNYFRILHNNHKTVTEMAAIPEKQVVTRTHQLARR